MKREDLIHPWLSGNKYRKLKYNILEAKAHEKNTMVTFGGAFSNHLYATAGAGSLFGFKSIGIVRGEIDLKNPTLKFCRDRGMELIPVTRSEYRKKYESEAIEDIIRSYKDVFVVPEGGTNELALKGVSELLPELKLQMTIDPDFFVLPCGTGGTTAGLLLSENLNSHVLSFSALNSRHLYNDILSLTAHKNESALTVNADYHFGGYAKWTSELLSFIKDFELKTGIELDHVYNGKAMYGLLDLINRDYFERGAIICYIHSGGLQGKEALNYILLEKNLQQP